MNGSAFARSRQAEPVHISDSLAQLLLGAFSGGELRHLAHIAAERGRVPEPIARAKAERLGEIYSTPPLESDGALIYNRPAVGFWRRGWERQQDDPPTAASA
jgi:hypothetical protein